MISCKKNKILATIMTFCILLNLCKFSYADDFVAAGQSKRNQIIYLLEICDLNNLNKNVTRAEFAKMVIVASKYKNLVYEDDISATFADVDINNEYRNYIKCAVDKKLMYSYLNGVFRPNEDVIYKDVIRAVLSLLGYENSDFAGNQSNGRLIKFIELELSKNVNRTIDDKLTKQEIINILYNLMKTNPKGSNSIYGRDFNLSIASNNELDGSNIITLNFTGPILLRSRESLSDIIPFSLSKASFYLNNIQTSSMNVNTAIVQNGYAILYYNDKNMAVQVFTEGKSANVESSATSLAVLRGYVEKINMNAGIYQVPLSVEIDGDLYYLESSMAQLALSNKGHIKKNDEVVFIFNKSIEFGGIPSQNSYTIASVSVLRRTASGITSSTYEREVSKTTGDILYKCISGIFLVNEGKDKTHFGND